MRGVWFRVLYGVLRTHSTFHDAERPSVFGRSGLRLGWFCCHTSLNCTRTINVVMWTGHSVIPFLHDFSCKVTKKSDIHKDSTQKTPRELISHPETTQKIGNSTLNHPKSNGKSSGKSDGKKAFGNAILQ